MLIRFFMSRPKDPERHRSGFLRRLKRDMRGVAAVEMALIAPGLILAYFGVAEVTMAMMASRRANHTTSAIGDLVTQSAQVGPKAMSDIFKIGSTLMRPFDGTKLKVRVTSIRMEANRSLTVRWSESYGGMTELTDGAVITDAKASTLLSPFESLVITETSYSFSSPLDYALKGVFTFGDAAYLKPRKSDEVVWVTNG
jgi:Flp pilus assembly protein TadG